MVGSRPRSVLCSLLCLVVLTASTTGSLRHAHADGDQAHHHGNDGPSAPASNGPSHRHLLLLGFTFYEGDAAPLPLADDPDTHPTGSIESTAPTAAPAAAPVSAVPPLPPSTASLIPAAAPVPRSPSPPPPLAVRATRTRSGVLSI